MRKVLLVAASVFFALPAFAEWQQYAADSSGTKFYFKPDAVKKAGKIYKVWDLQDYAAPDSKGIMSGVFFREINCAEKSHRVIQESLFKQGGGRGNGEISSFNSNFMYAAPGSVIESLIGLVCRK